MSVIWKYEIPLTDVIKISMPEGAKILHFGFQSEQVCIWVEVEPDNKKEERTFTTIGTGRNFDSSNLSYIGTYLTCADRYVWHVYEEVKC
jgi:hypothetical protein